MCSQGGLTWKLIRNMMSWASPSPDLLMQKLGDGGGHWSQPLLLTKPTMHSPPQPAQ